MGARLVTMPLCERGVQVLHVTPIIVFGRINTRAPNSSICAACRQDPCTGWAALLILQCNTTTIQDWWNEENPHKLKRLNSLYDHGYITPQQSSPSTPAEKISNGIWFSSSWVNSFSQPDLKDVSKLSYQLKTKHYWALSLLISYTRDTWYGLVTWHCTWEQC